MSSGFTHDPHSERGNACPKNRFGITDYDQLQPKEAALAFRRAGELFDKGVTGKFDPAHLKSIHRYLFQDVFSWAGEYRVVDITKGSSTFGFAIHIAGSLSDVLARLKAESYLRGLPAHHFASRAAWYLGEINAVHPFREGNGRTQREFIRQVGLQAGHPLSWTGFTQQQMTDASIASHLRGDCTGLESILEAALFSSREKAR